MTLFIQPFQYILEIEDLFWETLDSRFGHAFFMFSLFQHRFATRDRFTDSNPPSGFPPSTRVNTPRWTGENSISSVDGGRWIVCECERSMISENLPFIFDDRTQLAALIINYKTNKQNKI